MISRLLLGVMFGMSLWCGSAGAGEMTHGLGIHGGQNAGAQLVVVRGHSENPDVISLKIRASGAEALKGYGWVLHFDAAEVEFVSVENAQLAPSGYRSESTLFLAANNAPGQVSVGAVDLNGRGIRADEDLVVASFRILRPSSVPEFQISDAVLVDPDGGLDAVSRIDVDLTEPAGGRFGLDQNVPNPFNPATTIQYQIAEPGEVKLTIFSALGQEVLALVNAYQDAGRYTVTWQGQDALGRSVASGVYFYRLETPGFAQSRRMMLLK